MKKNYYVSMIHAYLNIMLLRSFPLCFLFVYYFRRFLLIQFLNMKVSHYILFPYLYEYSVVFINTVYGEPFFNDVCWQAKNKKFAKKSNNFSQSQSVFRKRRCYLYRIVERCIHSTSAKSMYLILLLCLKFFKKSTFERFSFSCTIKQYNHESFNHVNAKLIISNIS